MSLRRPLYFVRRALDAMARGPRVALVATGTIFVAVFVTGLFAATLHGAERLLATWAGEVQISVYLDPAADLAAARAAAAAAAPGRDVEAVTADEALRRFKETLGREGALLEGVRPEVLPPSIEVRAPGIRLAAARLLAKRLEAVPGAREVDYGNAWLERLERLLDRLRWTGAALLAALAAGAAVLVANTLRLGVFARRDEIEIMKLVGATDGFVEAPFLIEGLLQGVAGGALAAGALLAGAALTLPRVAAALALASPVVRADVLPPALLAALVAGGAALGLVASALAVGRELRRS
ncbi:MAG TPA: permease-like cell division protein FtsX [Anaeromyxobacteraceae bacterium]